MERKEKMGKQGECGADQEASQEAPRTRFVYNGTGLRVQVRVQPPVQFGEIFGEMSQDSVSSPVKQAG